MNASKPKCYSYIRFSTPEQLKGDSLRRQLEESQKYASANCLEIDESLSLRDIGISAFKGEHRTRGALGQFLELVKKERIPKGSTLIVESLDRLSREQVLDALQQFLAIIQQGIRIVTLIDGMEYSDKTLDLSPLIISITIMSRAHEESLMKSKRLSSAWEEKRKRIMEKKLTRKGPAWLELNEERTEFKKISERFIIINLIFEMSFSGKGYESIVKELNQKIKDWVPKNGWRKSYVQKILRNRAVIGEYQPHKLIDGKRKPVGNPIIDYYPKVVSDETFYKVQEQLSQNKHFGGRNGKISNLFGGLAKCGYCGAPMQFLNKGNSPKGGTYLVCDNARRGRSCRYFSVHYKEFEKLILTFCKGLNVDEIINDGSERDKDILILREKVYSLKGKLRVLSSDINNLKNRIRKSNDDRVQELLEADLISVLDDKDDSVNEGKRIQNEIKKLSSVKQDINSEIADIGNLFSSMDQMDENNLIELRLKLRNILRRLIDVIKVYPIGFTFMNKEQFDKQNEWNFEFMYSDEYWEKLKYFEESASEKNYFFRVYDLIFKSGITRRIHPVRPNPLAEEFERHEEDSENWMVEFEEKYGFAPGTVVKKGDQLLFVPFTEKDVHWHHVQWLINKRREEENEKEDDIFDDIFHDRNFE